MEKSSSVFYQVVAILFVCGIGCYGNDEPIQHLILLDDLPVSLDRTSPLVLDIRSDYKGIVEFQESDKFQVLLNVTAPSVGEAYMVHHEVVKHQDGLLIQVYKSHPSPWIPHITLYKIMAAILVLVALVLLLCLLVALWWYKSRRASENIWKDRGLDDSAQQQPLMYRSRNSMQLATQSGDMLLGEREGETTHEDVLHHVPEIPEDDESEIPMEHLKHSPKKQISLREGFSSDEDDLRKRRDSSKDRFESPSKKGHQDLSRIRKRAKGYKEDSFDMSDQSSDWSHQDEPERTNQNSCDIKYEAHRKKMTTFCPEMEQSPVQKSDGAIVYNTSSLRRYENMDCLPTSVPGQISAIQEKRGYVSNAGDSKSAEEKIIEDNIRNEKRGAPVPGGFVRAFDNRIYESSPPQVGQKLVPKGEYIYVNDVPPSYASHSDYPVHSDRPAPSNRLLPGLNQKVSYPPSPSMSNKDGSYCSDSGRSASIADSSDVFEENTSHAMFHDTDSEVEIPPLDLDDFPSSYMPESLRLQQKLAESPEKKPKKPSLMVIPRVVSKDPSPQNTPKLVTFQQPNATSPEHSASERGYKTLPASVPDHGFIKQPLTTSTIDTRSNSKPESQNTGKTSGTGNTGSLQALRNIHVAMVCSLCVLGLASGVYAQLLSETEVRILVLSPPGFLSNRSAVYLNKNRRSEVRAENIRSTVLWYEVPSARLVDVNSTQCQNNLCSQGCDANTGKCLCLRGFALSGDYDCIDVDECYEGSAKCSPYASCQDTQGSYRCICGNSYYGDGISCKACSTPCREGSFQVQPCIPDSKQQKICKACTTECHEGFYMYRKCNPQNDAICRMCQPRCESDQYEHTVCYGNQTRQCREKKWMPPPETSDNVLLEDLTEVKSHTFRIREDQDFDTQQDNVFRINRGSNLTVTIKIKELRISPQFRPVDFKHQSGKDGFLGLPKITSDYCPQPLPRYYKLSSRLYKDVYYKIGQTCSHGNCRSEPKPCKTFRSYGYYPNLRRRYGEFTLVCTESGPLAHLFGLNQQLTAATSSRAEVSDSCSSRLSACDDCTRGCARQVSQAKGDCEVRGDNGDNGWSPRLQSCYSCCVEPRCMEVCRNYTLSGCSPEMCRKGSLVEFKLEAVYARAASEFYCSVQPIKNQLLVSFEYSVQHRGQQLNKKSVSIFADEEWMNNGQMTKRDGFIDFTVASHVTRQPDVIAGDITTPAYWAGRYRGDGDALRQTGQETVYLHPRKPFLITPSEWKRSICSDDIVAKAFKAVKRDIPYKKMRDFRVNVEGRRVFSIANQTRAPELELHMGRYMSVLAAIYPRAEVSYETLTGSITHDNSQWVISIEGHVKRFPGVLSVNVSDTNYKETPLFMYDILVRRQRAFRLISRLPTGDHVTIGRDFTVSVRDANQTIHLMLHRPHTPIVENYETAAKNQAEPAEEDARRSEKEASAKALDETEDSLSDFPFSVPFIAAACGAIVLLLFMAGFGIFITPGDPSTDETSHFQPRHLLFAVMYFTFQVAYCLVVSLTTFVLVWVALNSESVSFIQQYGHQTALQKALNSLELARMQSHLVAEMRRQSDAANQTKSSCDLEIRTLVNQVEEEKKVLSLSVTPDLWREMKDRISKHTQTVLEDFSQQLTRARENYNYYANYLMEKLVFDIQQSYVSLVSSRWLDGAKFLHGTVRNVRTLLNRQDTRPFMEWMGLESSFSQFAVGIDLSMPLPPLPSVEDFTPGADRYQPSTPEPMTSSFVAVPPVVHVYNLWFNGDSEDMAPVYRTVERNNSSGSKPSDRGLSSRSELLIFVAVMVLIDVMWLIHRAVKAYRVSRLILCGYPLYVDCSENKGETSSERAQHCPLVTCCVTKKQSATRRLLTKTLSSLFIPKLVAMAMVCLFVYVTMTISTVLVRKETLASIGYYNDLENLLSLNKKLINGRLSANAERINTVEYPAYQDLLNMYVQRHLVLLEMTRQQHAADNISAAENGLPPFVNNINCRFPKLQPKLYQRVGNTEDMLIGRHADPLLQAVRKLVTDSCFLILLYLAVVAIKQLLNMVIWLYVKRAGLVHLWIIYETNADEIRVQER